MRELSMQNFKKPHQRISYEKNAIKSNKNIFYYEYTKLMLQMMCKNVLLQILIWLMKIYIYMI